MIVQLDWPPDVVDRLTGEARKKGLSLDAIFCKRFSSRRARTALMTTLRTAGGGPKPVHESWRFRSALSQIPKAGPPAITLIMGAVNGGRRH